MNPYQRACAQHYAGGEFAWLAFRCRNPDDWIEHAHGCGDLLFAFLMLELSSAEGCRSAREAQRRCEAAISDLVVVCAAVAVA